jgi:hypothetical protein
MKVRVSDRNISAGGLVGSLLVLWSLFAPWAANLTLVMLAVAAVSTTALWMGRRAPVPVTPAPPAASGKR